jgi:hypothetical protein
MPHPYIRALEGGSGLAKVPHKGKKRRGPLHKARITPEQLAYAVEHFHQLYYPDMDKSEFKTYFGRILGWSGTSLKRWIRGEGETPETVDWAIRLRHNYPEFSYEYIKSLPLPGEPPIPRNLSTLVALLEDIEKDSKPQRCLIGSWVRDWRNTEEWIWWSPALRRFWGLEDDAAPTYELFLNGVHPDDVARVEAAGIRYMSGKGGKTFRGRFRTINLKNRTEHCVNAHARIVFRGNKPMTSTGFLFDEPEK